MTKTISFHSYKGGTGKSLISLNISVDLAQRGFKVVLLDFDFLGPSMFSVFGDPKIFLNEVIYGKYDIMEAILEYTRSNKIKGKLYYGLADPEPAKINSIYHLDSNSIKQSFEKTMDAKEILEDELGADFLIIDTGPGIRMDSANAIVVSDHVSLVLKPTKADVVGTSKLISSMQEAYASKKEISVVLNRGLDTNWQSEATLPVAENDYSNLKSILEEFTEKNKIPIIANLPCVCDIARSLSDRMLILDYPDNIFCKSVAQLSNYFGKK